MTVERLVIFILPFPSQKMVPSMLSPRVMWCWHVTPYPPNPQPALPKWIPKRWRQLLLSYLPPSKSRISNP